MGQSIAGQLNQLPVDMQGNVLTNSPDPREMNGTFGSPGMGLPNGVNPQDAATDMMPTIMPGLGGKGGAQYGAIQMGSPGTGGKGGASSTTFPTFSPEQNAMIKTQTDMFAPVPEPTSMGGLPPAPNAQSPLGKVSGGTPGRPSASAPMVPRGPGFANPGAPGNPPPQPPERGILTNPAGQPMPFQGGQQNRLQPARPAPAVRPVNPYRPAPTVAQPVNVARRGAGRGGMLR
jgi:hypothetical protein